MVNRVCNRSKLQNPRVHSMRLGLGLWKHDIPGRTNQTFPAEGSLTASPAIASLVGRGTSASGSTVSLEMELRFNLLVS